MRKRLVSIILSAVVAATLCPLPASASALEVGVAETGDLGVQASKKTVRVLTRLSTTYNYDGKETAWGYNYRYNANGLLASFGNLGDKPSAYNKISYSGATPKKLTIYGTTESLSCDKKGRIVKSAHTSGEGDSKVKSVKTFTRDSKGRVIRAKYVDERSDGTRSSVWNLRFKYNAKGRVSSCKTKVTSDDGSSSMKVKYAYDAKGNLTRASNGSYNSKNEYGNGRLVARTAWGDTYRYEYKTMKVDASVAAKVKAQQWALLNRDIDCTFANNPISPTSAV